MKNLHLIQTDKPSRLHKIGNEWGLTNNPNFNPFAKQQNIYITADEEIKFNDYVTDGYLVWQWKDNSSLLGRKKIVLTTDQQLIVHGVQAIDDEFLQWFVKNPNCEEVMINPYCEKLTCKNDSCNTCCQELKYKIIISYEEYKMTLEEEKEFRKKFPKEFAVMDIIELDKAQEKLKEETLKQIAKAKAFDFAVDYKPFKRDLFYGYYAECGYEKGFIGGVNWLKEKIICDIELAMIRGLNLGEYRDLLIKENLK